MKHRKDLDMWNLGCWGGEGALCGRAAWGKGLKSNPTLEKGKVCPVWLSGLSAGLQTKGSSV